MARTYRIFISSPGDVQDERDALENLIKGKLQKTIGKEYDLFLEPVRWETHGRPTLGEVQENLFEQLGAYDIFVGFFWKRFGTPSGEHDSGSEAEFYHAYDLWEKDNSRPVMMYFCEREVVINMDEDLQQQTEQLEKVKAFREKVTDKGLYWTYTTVEDFIDKLHDHLYDTISALEKQHQLPEEEVPKDGELPVSTLTARVTDEAHQRYLRAFRRDSLQIPLAVLGEGSVDGRPVTLDQVFISLNVRQQLHSKRGDHKREDFIAEIKPRPALEEVIQYTHAVLLGDPGSGKSSFVKHLLANVAECQLSGAQPLVPDTENLLPVLIVLRDLAPRLAGTSLPEGHANRKTALANLVMTDAMEAAQTLQVPEFTDGIRQAFLDERVFLVFDGLDEVPVEQRKVVREAVGAALAKFHLPRALVTCRIRSYIEDAVFEGVPTYTLAKFTEEQITHFIDNWYQVQDRLGRVKVGQADERITNLTNVATKAPLLTLAQNPMLLTTMTIIHQQQASLPEERVRLYKLAVELLLRRWQEEHVGLPGPLASFLKSDEKVRPAVEHMAFLAHEAGTGDEEADLPHDELQTLLTDPRYLGKPALAAQFLEYIDYRSGLLIGLGSAPGQPTRYSFPHRTFQEYLAGCYVVGARGAASRLLELAEQGDFWSEAVRLGIEEQVYNSGSYGREKVLNLASQLTQNEPKTSPESRVTLWASMMAEVVGPEVVAQDPGDLEPGQQLLDRLRSQCFNLLSSDLPPIERAEAGRALATIGDYPELLTFEAMPFCHVPAGPFRMGDGNIRELDISYSYWISQYLVTQYQFHSFIEAVEGEDSHWWAEAGWKDRLDLRIWINRSQQYNQVFRLPNHPVVGVTLYEALAFTQWLTHHAREQGWLSQKGRILLPSAPEWEKAARGGVRYYEMPIVVSLTSLIDPGEHPMQTNEYPERRYPWGEEIHSNSCNFEEAEIGYTSRPGCFPDGKSPYDVHDMAGNVDEWQRNKGSIIFPQLVKEPDWDDVIDAETSYVQRGGANTYDRSRVRCARIANANPDYKFSDVGFRLVAIP